MRRVEKPWGYELIWAETDRYVGKVLHINAGERLSLQYHERKMETILVSRGKMELEFFASDQAPQRKVLVSGESFHINPGLRHRMIALEDTDVFEVSTPDLDDVVRLEDKYGRVRS